MKTDRALPGVPVVSARIVFICRVKRHVTFNVVEKCKPQLPLTHQLHSIKHTQSAPVSCQICRIAK